MKTRGRDSAASLAVITGKVESLQRPDAPYALTDEESAEWWAVVNRMPADWFPRETHGLLAQYCRHVVAANKIAQLIQQRTSGHFEIGDYDKLLSMQERESRALASLATRMRISQQGTYDIKKSKGQVTFSKKPWEE
jgi:hypothetical protein